MCQSRSQRWDGRNPYDKQSGESRCENPQEECLSLLRFSRL